MLNPKQLYIEEVKERLEKIAFYLEQRESNRKKLGLFRCSDCDPKLPLFLDLQSALRRLGLDDENTLAEMFHLREGVEKHFKSQGHNLDLLKAVTSLKAFKVIASFVNSAKHGTHGKGVLSTRVHSIVMQSVQSGPHPAPSDFIHDAQPLINHDGELHQASELSQEIASAWIKLFAMQPNNPFKAFEFKIRRLREKASVLSTYKAAIPPGLLKHAKDESNARKNIGRAG
ncbi:hypothetical protein ACFL2T_03285 [Elusimicrobiota bacterium]